MSAGYHEMWRGKERGQSMPVTALGRAQNKAILEGAFGLFRQRAGLRAAPSGAARSFHWLVGLRWLSPGREGPA